MVGIVIVSHCKELAEGVVQIAKMMAPTAPVVAAGGMEDGGLGTDFGRIMEAVESVYSDDGVLILMDMGSAVMTTEMVLETLDLPKIRMVDCPLVEGAVLAAVESAGGASFEELELDWEKCTLHKLEI